jgi:uncharacterized membrane protein
MPLQRNSGPQATNNPQQTQIIAQATSWAGPLPPPEVLEDFDRVINSGAERVFHQFELETQHRHRLQNRASRWQAYDLIIGKIFAFLFVVGALAVSAFAIHKGSPVAGTILGTGVLAAIVYAFTSQKK